MEDVSRITADELQQRLDRGEPVAVVDARAADSWAESDAQIPGSIRVPEGAVAEHADDVPRDRSVVTYCT
jgi:rhodanese-related sulfurtransferase